MKKKNKRKVISLLVCLSILFGLRQSCNIYMKKHPEILYDLNPDDEIISMIDEESFVDLDIIPALGTMVPQGITMSDNYIFLSLYDSLKLSKSMVYVLDFDFNLKRKVLLDTYSHVGGISFDPINNCLWTSGTHGSVCAYSVDDILSSKEVVSIYKNESVGKDLINYRAQKAVSFLNVYDNKLFVGNYTCAADGTMKIYDIECNDGNISLKYDSKFVIPTMVQGVSFYNLEGEEYILFSRSCGEDIKSYIQVYKFNENFDYHNSESAIFKMDSMLEQIHIDENGLLRSVFESNAVPYRDKDKIDDYKVFSLKKYIK